MTVNANQTSRVVEARAGSLAVVTGRGASSERGQLEMAAWKQIAVDAVATDAAAPLRLVFCGGVNQITGYRLYYMLQFAKRAGVRRLVLCTDGVFWMDEATDWLIESGVDEIELILPDAQPSAALAERARDLAERPIGGRPRPRLSVRAAGPDVFPASATIVTWGRP